MAITQGHGNPDWTREETILALALYLELEGASPPASHSRVQELSETLRKLPYHAVAARKQSFRNPSGVAFKLQNLRSVATGKGLSNVSNMDRSIWAEFGERRDELIRKAEEIIQVVNVLDQMPEEEESWFSEGRLMTELHKRRERDPRLRARILKSRRGKGTVNCDVCQMKGRVQMDLYQDAIFEIHHLNPLFLGERITRFKDVALLCANCHRLIHRMISQSGKWVTLDEAREVLR